MVLQTSFGIPAEGVYAGLIIVLLAVIAAMAVMIGMMAKRNMRLVDDNREITRDAITGFQNVIASLNAIREQVLISDNAIMNQVNNTHDSLNTKLGEISREVVSHLQYLRDRSKG